MVSLRQLLDEMIKLRASDLHISAGVPPQVRIDGSITPMQHPPLTPTLTQQLAYSVLTEEQRKRFETTKELDLSFGVPGLSRFRANVFLQRGVTSMAIRQIPYEILSFEQLGLGKTIRDFTTKLKGLVLVTGPTGSGKSTTLATMAAALTIAETGHLVLATLHTNSAYESINRIVDAFPSTQQQQVLSQLAFVLEGVVTQQLIPKAKGPGRVMVPEVLICTPAVRAVIRERKTHQIYSLMQAGTKHGMQTMNQALFQAYIGKQIALDEALGRSSDAKELEGMLEKVGVHVAA